MSKAMLKQNLYVKGLPDSLTRDDELKKFFERFGKVKNAKVYIMDTGEKDLIGNPVFKGKGYGFVCYENQKDAATVVAKPPTELLFGDKILEVFFYEPKQTRNKKLTELKAKQDEMIKQNPFITIMPQLFGNMNFIGGLPRTPFMMGGRGMPMRGMMPGRGFPQRGRGGAGPNLYVRPPQGPPGGPGVFHGGMAGAPGPMPPRPTGPTPDMLYANGFSSVINTPDFHAQDEDEQKNRIGEFIYAYVEKSITKDPDEVAPKITGMIIDLPVRDLIDSVRTLAGLRQKVEEGLKLIEEED